MKSMKLLAVAFFGLGLAVFAAEKSQPGLSESIQADPQTQEFPSMGSIERLDAAVDALLGPGARIEKLAQGFAWSEGPVWIPRKKYLLFSDVPRNVVFLWKEGAPLTDYMIPSGYSGSKPRGGERSEE